MNQCAWCGDPDDKTGSHSICDEHAAIFYEQLAIHQPARKEGEDLSGDLNQQVSLIPGEKVSAQNGSGGLISSGNGLHRTSQKRASLRIHLFDKFSVERDGQAVTGLEARRVQDMLSYLLLNRSRRCSREMLATLFWGESSTAQSKKNLRHILWQLQTAWNTETETPKHRLIFSMPDWVQINPAADLWLDVDVFERTWIEVRHKAGKDLEATEVQRLRNAVALHRGPLLNGNYEDWCLQERERLLTICIEMLEKLMEHCEASHDYPAALTYGSRILDYDPTREMTHRSLMRLYCLLDQRVEALKQYQRCEAILQEELGTRPSKSTRLLHQQILLDRLENKPGPAEATLPTQGEIFHWIEILEELKQIHLLQANLQRQVQYHIQVIEQALQSKSRQVRVETLR
ncbi:MAG TPA: bacterial transcriptional activator domain-containing protein [Ktedonosporobacter sp.]|nr:bacterial transcriptional activator domain-containing protein [Ktedonosporobacter sp.]